MPWTTYLTVNGTVNGTYSSSKREHGSNFSHFRSDAMGTTCETKQPLEGLDLQAMAARWEHTEKNTLL